MRRSSRSSKRVARWTRWAFYRKRSINFDSKIKAMLPAEWKKMFEEALKFMRKIVDIMLKIRKGRDS